MKRPHRRNLIPRIVALGLQGCTAQAVSYRLDCSEVYAQQILQAWRGGAYDQQERAA